MRRIKDPKTGKYIRDISLISQIPNTKICSKCKEIKKLSDFGKCSKSFDGRRGICKECRAIYETPKRKDYTYNLYRKRKLQVLVHYGGNPPKCACCGESNIEFLQIDHIYGGGRRHMKNIGTKGGIGFHTWLIKHNFPSGFRVLCANCNFSLGHCGYCPHHHQP